MTMKGGAAFLNETDKDRENARINALHQQIEGDGGYVIHADEARMHLMRHLPGNLDSIKDLNYEQIEAARKENAQVLEDLCNAYFSTKQNKQTGKMIRKMMGYDKKDKLKANQSSEDVETFGNDRVELDEEDDEAQVIQTKS